MITGSRLRDWLYWKLYPGVNLHARLRYRYIPMHFGGSKANPLKVLDAGSGNGMLSYQSYARGNDVLGISFNASEVEKASRIFNQYLRIPESRLKFRCGNLYDLDDLEDESFDEIICSETLEHLRQDEKVCRSFWRLLKPGGVLHVCAPNAEHPYNATFPLDIDERGGHVRPGYTMETYRLLLQSVGFTLESFAGLGGSIRQWFNRHIKETQGRFGAWSGVPLFVVSVVFLPLESKDIDPEVPFSIYVKARKGDPHSVATSAQ